MANRLQLIPNYSDNKKEHWQLTANHGVTIDTLTFHVKKRYSTGGEGWEGQDELIANILKFAMTHKELREIQLNLDHPECTSFDIALGRSICQAFLANPFVPVDSKRFYFKIRLEEKYLVECFGLLRAIQDAVVGLKFTPYPDDYYSNYQDCVEGLSENVASLSQLHSLDLQRMGSFAQSIILKELATAETGCRIRDLCLMDEGEALPSSLSDFLSSESGSCLQTIKLLICNKSAIEEVRNLTQALLRIESLTSMELEIDDDLAPEMSQVLSQYFKDESKLKTLKLVKFFNNAVDVDRKMDSLRALLSGLQENTSIKDLRLIIHFKGAAGGVVEEFFQRCQVENLVFIYPLRDREVQALADGLRYNQSVRTLNYGTVADDYLGEINVRPLAKMLTMPGPPLQAPPLTLEHLVLNCGDIREVHDPGHLYDLVRRPIPTLKSIHLKLFFDADAENFITGLLDALQESCGVESFGLEFEDVGDEEECFESLCNFLPQLSNISCLAFKAKTGGGVSHELKLRLYQSALLNTGLTSLALEPLCERDPQFKLNLKFICTRNKAQKALTGLQDYSLSLRELPAILEDIQRDCREMGVSPEYYNTALINASLRQSAEPETMQLIGNHLADKGSK